MKIQSVKIHEGRLDAAALTLALAALLVPAPSRADAPEQPVNRIVAAPLGRPRAAVAFPLTSSGSILHRSVTPGPGAPGFAGSSGRSVGAVTRPAPRVRPFPVAISPRSSALRETVFVTFREPLDIPRFPTFAAFAPGDSAARQAARDSALSLARAIALARRPQFETDSALLANNYAGEFVRTYWLIRAISVSVPFGTMDSVALDPSIVSIRPMRDPAPPPATCMTTINLPEYTIDRTREKVGLQLLEGVGLPEVQVGIMDTGVRFSHSFLQDLSPAPDRRDCIEGRSLPLTVEDCSLGFPEDACLGDGHGTSTAAILSGHGGSFRGLTDSPLTSYRVYFRCSTPACACTLNASTDAVVRAFQLALLRGDRVIAAQLQMEGTTTDPLADPVVQAAENAFKAGAVVIAANGNQGRNKLVLPSVARGVIGVGAYDALSGTTMASQSYGVTSDGRIKPDLQTLTNSGSASNCSDDAMRYFTDTSGATPYAAGVAARLLSWLDVASATTTGQNVSSISTVAFPQGGPLTPTTASAVPVDPGQLYAMMILSSQKPFFVDKQGAGRLRIPEGGVVWFGKVEVGTTEVPVPIGTAGLAMGVVEAALWWPEPLEFNSNGSVKNTHNNINLEIAQVAKNGRSQARARSVRRPGVFERAATARRSLEGQWVVRVKRGPGPIFGTVQPVYLAAWIHP